MLKYNTDSQKHPVSIGIQSEMIDVLPLPSAIEAPRIDLTEWGGRLPDRPYFPVYLGNGRDGMLINIMGTGETHWSGNMRSFCPLPRQLNTAWYKADRRVFEGCDLQYGHQLPFVDFSGGPMLHGDVVVPRELKQYFDPRTATVTTLFKQYDNRTMHPLELRIMTFLTSDGLLVQSVDFLDTPECGVRYFFSLGEPGPEYLNTAVPFVKPREPLFTPENDPSLLRYSSHWEQGRAVGFSLVGGVAVEKIVQLKNNHPAYVQFSQRTAVCKKGDRIWRVLSIQDNREGGDPQAVCDRLIEQVRSEGIDALWASHCSGWKDYFDTSGVVLPDRPAQFLYDVSRYYIKANLHPDGFLPMGILPYQWQGVAFWDGWFAQQAFLGCGNLAEAGLLPQHFMRLQEEGRELARSQGAKGVRIEWTTGLRKMTRYRGPQLQFHNNSVWAYAIFQQASYAGEVLTEAQLEFAEELLLFMVDRLLEPSADGVAKQISGVDESENDLKPNDTWTLAISLKALESYYDYCEKQGIGPRLGGDRQHHVETLRTRLLDNVDEHGVLQSFSGGRLPHWGSLVFDLYPAMEQGVPTIAAMAKNHDPDADLFNFHGVNRYAEKMFPWANFWASRCLGRMERKEALHFWLNSLRCCNIFGGIPERVYYHGELYINWFLPGHASLVWSMNGMLAHSEDGTLILLGGIDPSLWKNLSCESILAGDGLKVSLTLNDGQLKHLRVCAEESSAETIRVIAPHHAFDRMVTLKPGQNSII